MRYISCLMLFTALTLAACGGDNSAVTPELPTQASLDATQETQPIVETPATEVTEGVAETTPEGEQTPDVLAGVVIMPGTVVAPATEDPAVGQPFNSILYIQTGGASNSSLTVEVFADGRVMRNGTQAPITMSPDQIQELNGIIQRINFFSMQGSFTAAGGNASDTYRYSISVERADGSSRTINAQDGLVPTELSELFVILVDAGLDVPGR